MSSKEELVLMTKRLQQAMLQSELSYGEIANLTGIPKSAVHRYISGETPKVPLDRLKKIAHATGVSAAWIMGWSDDKTAQNPFLNGSSDIMKLDNILPMPKMNKKPRLGAIACGEPILAVENIEEYDNVPENINCDFTLKCKGDSMIDARINDGDIVYIRQQPTVESGQIAAVLINDEATLKRVYLSDNAITLLACNPKYEPFVYSGKELEQIKIIGKAVGFTSAL